MNREELIQLSKLIADEVNVKEVVWETPDGDVTYTSDTDEFTFVCN